jgi:hypothetical protein
MFKRTGYAVPELTRSADIKLNERLSLRGQAKALALRHRTVSPNVLGPPWQSRQAIIFHLAAWLIWQNTLCAEAMLIDIG